MSFFHSIAEFFNEGGPTMYITGSAGLCGAYIAYDRGLKLFKTFNHDTAHFMARVKELMLQNRLEDAVQFCNLHDSALLSPVIKSGLERAGCEEGLVRQSMESVYLEQVPKVTDKIGYLSLIANAGMLFGLLGTVLGLIRQFGALASADAANKQMLMARGIGEAMNNTALGLMVALPCLIVHGIYSTRASKILEELERSSSQFLDWMGLYNYGQLHTRLQPGAKKKQESHLKAAA